MSHSDGPTYLLNQVKAAKVSAEKEFTRQGRKETREGAVVGMRAEEADCVTDSLVNVFSPEKPWEEQLRAQT